MTTPIEDEALARVRLAIAADPSLASARSFLTPDEVARIAQHAVAHIDPRIEAAEAESKRLRAALEAVAADDEQIGRVEDMTMAQARAALGPRE
jgi:hypothetical protein